MTRETPSSARGPEEPLSVLIENGAVLPMVEGAGVLEPGYVALAGDRIAAVGAGQPPAPLRARADHIIDAANMAVLPGLVNAHTHLFQTFIRGLADDKTLLPWLAAAIWPVGAAMHAEEAYLAGLLGLIENVRSGATAVIDNQYLHSDDRTDDAFCRAARDVGGRLLIARGWADRNYHATFQETPERVIEVMTALYQTWHNKAEGRVRVEFGPLIPWGCSESTLRRTVALARSWGVGTHMHTAETREEVQQSIDEYGLRHVHWLDRLGVLGPDVQLVHSVWLDESEIERVAETETVVVHCPTSNMYLASGIAPVTRMLRRGIAVALATDGPGSNNSQDMLETLKFTACLAKVGTLDPTALLPGDVLKMACQFGSRAFGQPDLGRLAPGCKSDVVLVDLDSPRMQPVLSVPSALVYNANGGDVDTVIVDGRILMQGKRITCLDEPALLAECRTAARRLLERAGVKTP
jgi:5-methylthioadenosine/S-adenosylhomocysteine deaminase